MSIFKDWQEDTKEYRFTYKLRNLFSPALWLKLHKWRKQRADRGWSDRDTWAAGDYIARMTADILQHLNDNTHVDWPDWFKYNCQEKGKDAYKDLQSVIDDIIGYLDFEKNESWSKGLDIASDDVADLFDKATDGSYSLAPDRWVDEVTRKPVTQQQITSRIKKYRDKEIKQYKKAQKAMQFFGRNFTGFWD